MRRRILHVMMFLFFISSQATLVYCQVPEWAKGAVWYQIFPDRFLNGYPGNDPVKENVVSADVGQWQVHPWTSDWFKLQEWERDRNLPFYDIVRDRRYGGDLIGVIEKLDYLQKLGVEVIYFNPIFEAQSMHKYDATTYHHVDNNFGYDRDGDMAIIMSDTDSPEDWSWSSADSVFLQLINKAHELGVRIVLDGVFNHCGREFWAFQDVLKNQQSSRFKDWFDVIAWDDPATPDTNEFDYNGWWGIKSLPEFREDENGLVEPVRNYIFNITRRWMDPNGDGDPSDGVDGWRLDVARFVKNEFWRDWQKFVKSINPEAITVGEIWYGGTPAEQIDKMAAWVSDKRLESNMNYPFAYALMDFFVDEKTRISATEFDLRLRAIRQAYPEESNHILMNLLDSHDTDRLASMVKNPDREYDRMCSIWDNPEYDLTAPSERDRQIANLIILFQMTYIGAPAIYYGDETGMWGADDPDDRKPMVWQNLSYENETYSSVLPANATSDSVVFNKPLFERYQKLISIRKKYPVLKSGKYQTILADNEKQIFAFQRFSKDDTLTIVLNRSHRDEMVHLNISSPGKPQEILFGKKEAIKTEGDSSVISLSPLSGVIIH